MRVRALVLGGQSWAWEAFQRAGAAALGNWAYMPTFSLVQRAIWQYGTPKYVFFVHWSEIVDADFVRRHACVNFHCTALPYGRGGAPIENLILAGHTETVITAHRMTAELDAGPIYGTRGPVSLAGTKAQILERFVEPVADLMRWIVETNPEPVPQVGEPVIFRRLSDAAYQELWQAREAEVSVSPGA